MSSTTRFFAGAALVLALTSATVFSAGAAAKTPWDLPMGSPGDVAYAASLWSAMEAAGLVGADARELEPFFGGAKPHGMILELAYQDLAVAAHSGFLVIKKNYDGDGVSEQAVKADRARFLSAITVMYEREAGYDEVNQNWFWVKYKPDGSLFTKPIGGRDVALAGRIVKGPTPEDNGGCIYCHRSAGGGDYIFYPQVRIPGGPRPRN